MLGWCLCFSLRLKNVCLAGTVGSKTGSLLEIFLQKVLPGGGISSLIRLHNLEREAIIVPRKLEICSFSCSASSRSRWPTSLFGHLLVN